MRHRPAKRPKFFYPVGLISLIGLPMICLWYLNKRDAFHEYRMTSVVFYPKEGFMGFKDGHWYAESFPMPRNYRDFKLGKDTVSNAIAFENARKLVHELILTKDTLRGIHFEIDDNTPFQEFIKIIDICRHDSIRHFIPNGNDFWICNPDPPRKEESTSGFMFGGCIVYTAEELANRAREAKLEREKREREQEIQLAKSTTQEFALPIILFLIMVGLSVRQIRSRSKA